MSTDETIDFNNELSKINHEYEQKFKSIRCYLIEDNIHFLSHPRVLPCSFSACTECISKSININNQTLDCIYCHSQHKIENVSDLKPNDSIIDSNLNTENLNQYIDKLKGQIYTIIQFKKKLKIKIKEIKIQVEFSSRDEAVEKLCSKAKQEISDRIEAVKSHLDTLHKEMLDSLAMIKKNVSIELEKMKKQADLKTQDYDVFSQKMRTMLENFEENKYSLEKEIFRCQDYIDEMQTLDQNFHKILRKISFEASDWIPDESFVCNYIGKFDLNELDAANGNDSKDKA